MSGPKDFYSVSTGTTFRSANKTGAWQALTAASDLFGTNYRNKMEGPELFEYNQDDWLTDVNGVSVRTWGLMADYIGDGGKGYQPFHTTDLSNTIPAGQPGSAWSKATAVDFDTLLKRHGTILPVSAAELAAAEAAIGQSGDLATIDAADRAALESVVEESLMLDPADYTPASWNAFAVALSRANAVAADPVATQAATNDSAAALHAARGALAAPAPALDISVTTSTRCVVGKVVLVVTTTNASVTPVALSVTTPYGSKQVAKLDPAKSTTTAFTTRLALTPRHCLGRSHEQH